MKVKNLFKLSVVSIDGCRAINFCNNSPKFVEVVFTINGKEVKEGKLLSSKTRGYAYPPKLEKPVKKMKNGRPLVFGSSGMVQAHIFAGEGQYKDEDLDKPTFLRHELVDKVKFKRTSDQPFEILQIKY